MLSLTLGWALALTGHGVWLNFYRRSPAMTEKEL